MMAASAAVLRYTSHLLCSCLLLTAVASNENTTSDVFTTTAPGEQNGTSNFTEGFPTEPTGFERTTATPTPTPSDTPSSTTEEPSLPAEPLPVSGRLPPPVTSVGMMCPCDAHRDVCDVNCCCDRECSSEEVSLFTGCSVQALSGSHQLCSRDVASYSLISAADGRAELRSSVRKESSWDVLCIRSQNRFDGFRHPSPALPTDRSFGRLFQQFAGFLFGSGSADETSSPKESPASPGYQLGDVMLTAAGSGQTGTLQLPAPGLTADCVDSSPAAFLRDQSGRCRRRLLLEQDCGSLPALRMDTYANVRLLAGKNTDAAVVPVDVASVVLQSTDGTRTELRGSGGGGGEALRPVLSKPGLCANVVLEVAYVIQYSPAGEVVNASVSVVLGFVREASLPLQQHFQVTYVQEDGGAAVRHSGNPGYVVGLPLVAATRTADGLTRSVNPRDTLSVLRSTEDQDCLRGPHQRSPVLFGVHSVSGCTFRWEDTANCSLLSQQLLNVLRGPNSPQYVASFGNSPLDNPLDWLQISSNFIFGDPRSCSVPVSLHLEIQWTKYGSFLNPQAQIVSVKEVIQTNSSSLAQLSGGSNMLPITSSVAFIPVSAPAQPGYRAMPTIDAKLPFDFFFPFV